VVLLEEVSVCVMLRASDEHAVQTHEQPTSDALANETFRCREVGLLDGIVGESTDQYLDCWSVAVRISRYRRTWILA